MGTMQYGSTQAWHVSDHDEAIRQLKYTYDVGINVRGYPFSISSSSDSSSRVTMALASVGSSVADPKPW